ncbi:MAG: hypothetical protein L0Y56_21455 [Nitrospira sp.]|nr:hypothetical protein [Nitrospira sp.]
MPYLSERQRANIITLVKDLDAQVHCDVVKSDDNNDGFLIILSKGATQIKLDISEDDLEDAVYDPKTQSEMRWRLKKALQSALS